MSGEIIAILSVGIGLGLLSTGLFAWLRTDLVKVEERLRADLVTVEERLRADFKQLADRVGRLEYGQARLEGLLEGLREAITGRPVQFRYPVRNAGLCQVRRIHLHWLWSMPFSIDRVVPWGRKQAMFDLSADDLHRPFWAAETDRPASMRRWLRRGMTSSTRCMHFLRRSSNGGLKRLSMW